MRTIDGATLGVQAVLWKPGATAPSADAFVPIIESERRKPRGGLWTSTYTGPDTISGWVDWCRGEEFATGEHDLWLLTPEPGELLEVDDYPDLRMLHHVYGNSRRIGTSNYFEHYLDFGLIGERYAGLHLTDEGQWRTRLSDPYDLYGWDCESTLWTRWAFVEVEHVGRVTV